MYKKLHKEEKDPLTNPLSPKGLVFLCVPERVIMLTKDVYDMHIIIGQLMQR
jgi:hypothetical protein